MAFVKLDCGILDSTLWVDREAREVFITALLMAEPREFQEPLEQISVQSLEHTGWQAPPGWYGFVAAAGIGIVHRSRVEQEAGLAALERLGDVDMESRSQAFEGRRLIRINGGYVVLNFMAYRDRDYNGAERAKRYRERLKARKASPPESPGVPRSPDMSHRDVTTVTQSVTPTRDVRRDITQSECRVQSAEEYQDSESPSPPLSNGSSSRLRSSRTTDDLRQVVGKTADRMRMKP